MPIYNTYNQKQGNIPDLSWHEWWLNGRQPQLASNMYQPMEEAGQTPWDTWGTSTAWEEYNRQLDNARRYKEYYINPYSFDPVNSQWSSINMQDLQNPDLRGITNGQDEYIMYNMLPEQTYSTGYVKNYGNNFTPIDSLKAHEVTHALFPFGPYAPQVQAVDKIMHDKYNEKWLNDPQYKEEYGGDAYVDDPNEITARLYSTRKEAGLDPTHIVGKSDLNNMRNSNNVSGYNKDELLNRYDDDTLLRLFNEVAQNSTDNNMINYAANGGSIHINPKNKGKFNATKKRTGKTTEELTHSKNPLTRKRAIFAQNAKKWKHDDGGYLINNNPIDPPTLLEYLSNYRTPEGKELYLEESRKWDKQLRKDLRNIRMWEHLDRAEKEKANTPWSVAGFGAELGPGYDPEYPVLIGEDKIPTRATNELDENGHELFEDADGNLYTREYSSGGNLINNNINNNSMNRNYFDYGGGPTDPPSKSTRRIYDFELPVTITGNVENTSQYQDDLRQLMYLENNDWSDKSDTMKQYISNEIQELRSKLADRNNYSQMYDYQKDIENSYQPGDWFRTSNNDITNFVIDGPVIRPTAEDNLHIQRRAEARQRAQQAAEAQQAYQNSVLGNVAASKGIYTPRNYSYMSPEYFYPDYNNNYVPYGPEVQYTYPRWQDSNGVPTMDYIDNKEQHLQPVSYRESSINPRIMYKAYGGNINNAMREYFLRKRACGGKLYAEGGDMMDPAMMQGGEEVPPEMMGGAPDMEGGMPPEAAGGMPSQGVPAEQASASPMPQEGYMPPQQQEEGYPQEYSEEEEDEEQSWEEGFWEARDEALAEGKKTFAYDGKVYPTDLGAKEPSKRSNKKKNGGKITKVPKEILPY